ncbi:MAG: glycosyltransferase [Bacteroidia bacterium]|nr:glycosyltransferase [Bacteroidia bacterium]
MIDVLVISHACFKSVNRKVYSRLAQDGLTIELVVPKHLNYPAGKKQADPKQEGEPEITFVELVGSNPRTYQYSGILEILDKKKPRYVLLDNDPVSRMTLTIGKWIKRNRASKLLCLSCENLSLSITAEVKRRGLKYLPISLAKRFMLFRAKKVVDTVFTINNAGTAIFKAEGFRNVIKTPLGFDASLFSIDDESRKRIRTENKVQTNDKLIAYFGRLTYAKGVHVLLEALSKLKQKGWTLMMDQFEEYSSGYEKELQQLIEQHDLAKNVVFVNPSHLEISRYMNAADLVVVPSVSTGNWKEQYGRVIPEAMACGKTIIASASGAIPEILGEYGMLIEENQPDVLASTISSWLNGENIVSKSPEEIARYSVDYFSIEAQVKVFQNIFSK